MTTSDPAATPADRRVFRPTVLDLGDVRLSPWGRALDLAGGTVPALVAAAADPEIAHWNPLHTADPAAAEAYLDRCDARWADGSSAAFAITDAADATLLGNAYLEWTDPGNGVVMVGYWLLAAARGRGLATRATTAVTRWAVEAAGARRIELYHFVDNGASCRVAVRAGFPYEGTLRASYRRAGGEYADEHLHARLATDPFTDTHRGDLTGVDPRRG
ncbi:RimJ/RimL family protein N-acetyltransferase [Streptomyces sp. 1114.5]|uniref:GNAT family N-acetyltransferase n=1 Tax=unclassified Streptomyces TaxID=2593676 RepID=UPI000BCAB06A|nr:MULTISPECIES: GNAT family N-acetyltransferase [unclassified Streptomyces]RKT08885.1 RimJ/RimL family protein N-acetyltransferase [Streptomyces sp. 1114.5]SOB79248.1 Protein N-acetyltransferase, RimJ/RimL family [Streptomyces sp. 1331.2]